MDNFNFNLSVLYTPEFRNLINDIIGSVQQSFGIIYGGFVRDIIAGNIPKDMDIRFANEAHMNNFTALLKTKYITKIKKCKRGYATQKLVIKSNGKSIFTIDMHVSNEQMEIPDYDVNGLYYNGTQLFAFNGNFLDSIVSNIKAKCCIEVKKEIPTHREKKMLNKGYTIFKLVV